MNIVIVATASLLVLAHAWYKEKTDPQYKTPCCGGTDCGEFIPTPDVLTAVPEGYRITMTVEQTQKVNPFSQFPIDAIVTWNRIQPSEDGKYHICLMTYGRDNPQGGIYCLFAPPDA